jgi:hypothetical protein
MSDDEKIYVDASRPATLNSGGGVLDDCPTLQEAVMAWHRRPSRRKGRRSKFLADRFILRRRSSGSTTDTSRECDAPPLCNRRIFPRNPSRHFYLHTDRSPRSRIKWRWCHHRRLPCRVRCDGSSDQTEIRKHVSRRRLNRRCHVGHRMGCFRRIAPPACVRKKPAGYRERQGESRLRAGCGQVLRS